jgi:hypothetical protein
MSLAECAPWLFEYMMDHEVTQAEAAAVRRLFASLSPSDAEEQLTEADLHDHLPLHLAARRAKGRYAMEVVRAMFNAYPAAAQETLTLTLRFGLRPAV